MRVSRSGERVIPFLADRKTRLTIDFERMGMNNLAHMTMSMRDSRTGKDFHYRQVVPDESPMTVARIIERGVWEFYKVDVDVLP